MDTLTTQRLAFSKITRHDAPFVMTLLNEPGYIEYVGDRGVRSVADAERYINDKFTYSGEGYGFYLLRELETGVSVGFAGLLDRAELDHVDVGYAIRREFAGRGYAFEAAKAAVDFGHDVLGLEHVSAIISPGNVASINIALKLGMKLDKQVRYPADGETLDYYVIKLT